MRDVVIIGHGPAACSAAIYLCRAGKAVSLIGKDGGALQKAEKIENYYGLAQPLFGPQLAALGLQQVEKFGGKIIRDEIFDITFDTHFTLTGKEQDYEARTVIIAGGAERKTLPVKGLSAHEGQGVSYCAVCDAFFYRQKTVGVVGAGSYALHELGHLLNVVGKAYLFTEGTPAPDGVPEGVTVVTEKLSEVTGETVVDGVLLQNGERIELSGLFIALGAASSADFARKLGALTENGAISVDKEMKTAVPGLFAAGDCTGGLKQISTAVAQGAQAAMSVISFLNKRD